MLKFAADGKFLLQWGTKGKEPGQFDLPHGIALDGTGRVFVVDRQNARVQVFESSGKYLTQWKSPHFVSPQDIKISSDRTAFVAEGGNDKGPDRTGVLVMRLDGFPKKGGWFSQPCASNYLKEKTESENQMTKALRIGALTLITVGLIAWSSVRNAGNLVASAAGSVTATGSMSTARAAHTATLLPSGRVLITGGMERNGGFFASAELYDPDTGKFTPTGSMVTKRVGHRAVLLRTGKVLIIGGSNHEDGSLASAELYDPATGAFTLTGSMKEKGGGLATVLADGRVLVAGGYNKLYDPSTGTFSLTGKTDLQQSSTATLLTLLKSGKLLLTGSVTYPAETPLAKAELYDPASDTFTAIGNMTKPRAKQAATLLPDGRVLITGGMDRNGPQGRTASAEIYDPAKNSFVAIANMSMARFKHAETTVVLPNGKILIAGGGERAEVFDPATSTFSVASGSLDQAWFFATATLLQNGKVLIVGGYSRGVVCTSGAWIYQS